MFGATEAFRPEPYHVGVWFWIAILFFLGWIVADSLHSLYWAKTFDGLSTLALLATLVCRLALVEHEVAELKALVARIERD